MSHSSFRHPGCLECGDPDVALGLCESCGAPRAFASPNVAVCPACLGRALDVVRLALPVGGSALPGGRRPVALPARDRYVLRAAAIAFVAMSLVIIGSVALSLARSFERPPVRLGPRAFRSAYATPVPVPARAYQYAPGATLVPRGSPPPAPLHAAVSTPVVPAPFPLPDLRQDGVPVHDPRRLLARAWRLQHDGVDLTMSRTTLPRGVMEQLQQSVFGSAPSAHVMPSYREGRAIGMEVVHIQRGSTLERAGLMNGDVIATLNGYPTVSSGAPEGPWFTQGAPSMLVAEVLRGGHWIVLAVDWT